MEGQSPVCAWGGTTLGTSIGWGPTDLKAAWQKSVGVRHGHTGASPLKSR